MAGSKVHGSRFRVQGSRFKVQGSRLAQVYEIISLQIIYKRSNGMKIEQFEDIEAWQLARELTRKVYRLTKKPEFAKDYGLKRQIQDAAGSSMHNVDS